MATKQKPLRKGGNPHLPSRRGKPHPLKNKLNEKQKKFVLEYAADSNASRAARAAGYSKKTAGVKGCMLLKVAKVHKAVEEKIEATLARLGITHERILKEYRRLAFANNKRVMRWGPNGVLLKDSDTLSKEDSAAVAEVSETTSKDGGSLRLKMHDKKGALDALAKMSKMFVEKIEVSGPDGKPLEVQVLRIGDREIKF